MATPLRNIYEQQAANRRNTLLVMLVFILFVGFLGFGFDTFLLGFSLFPDPEEAGVPIPLATMAAILIGTISAFWSLQSGARAVLASSQAVPAPRDDPRYQQLQNVVDEMTIASGLPRPQVYIVPDPDPNAFAAGKDPQHACIAVTQGLLEKLNRDELQAVIAHEMSHIRNFDIRMMTVVAALVGAVMLLSEYGLRAMRAGAVRGGRKSSSRGGGGGLILLVLWVVAMILAPFISQLLAMGVSRQREFLADASGAELTRNPSALASALEKIDGAVEPTRAIKKGTAPLCIADPLGAEANDREGFLADLFATHPPVRKRIMALRAMSYQPTAPVAATPLPGARA